MTDHAALVQHEEDRLPADRERPDDTPSAPSVAPSWRTAAVLVGPVVLGMAIRLGQLRSAIFGPHEFRQTQTLFPVRYYSEHGIDLFFTYLPVFGSQRNVPFELPLYQALASLPTHVGLEVLTSSRLVSVASFEASAVLVSVLLLRWAGLRAAVVAMVLFQFLPYGIQWGTIPLVDFFSVALGLGGVLLCDSYARSGRWPLLASGAVLCWLTLLVKVTTFPTIGVLLVLAAYQATLHRPVRLVARRLAAYLVAGPVVGLVWLFWWTLHADAVKASSPSSAWLTSSALHDWNFGTTDQRESLVTYQTILARVGQEIAGPGLLAVVVALVAAFLLRRHRVLVAGFLVSAMVSPLIFVNLYFVHSYYLIAVFPCVVAAAALGIDLAAGSLTRAHLAWPLALGLVAGLWLLVWTTPGGRVDADSIDPVVVPNGLADELRATTGPTDRILMVACDWDPTILWRAGREGLMITGHEPSVDWQEVAGEGYSYVLACDANPGATIPPQLVLAPTAQPHVFAVNGWQG